ncbi:MAG: TolC family protein [Bacteroidetes bacterium]|nr:MAG: TolC family protein [Bacteroidota bacterium]
MRILLFFCCILTPAVLFSQEKEKPWSLQQCIEFALKNNIQIKQNILNQRIAAITHLQNKAQFFPSLSGSISHSYNNGKKIDPFSNEFITGDWSLSQNFSLSASVTLFGGFQNLNSIKQSSYDLLAAQQDVLKMQNDVSLNIASAYLQILFAQELLEIARSQSEITKLQADRTRKLVDAGNLPKGNLFDMEAQMAMEEVNVVNAENSLSFSSLNLMQMINLDTAANFTIAKPDIAPPVEVLLNNTSGHIYDLALIRQPEIKSAEFKLKSSEKSIVIARAGMFPRLSLSASYGTGYSSLSKYPTNVPSYLGYAPNGDLTSAGDTVLSPQFSDLVYGNSPFNDQIDQNLNRSVGFYLTLPIFNNLQTYSAISRAKISRENAQLTLQLQKDNLRKTIQQAFNDAASSLKKFQASRKAVAAMEESFKYTDQKYNVGAITATDYSDAKNKLTKAKSDMLQAKYDYVFKLKVLDFYQGKPITL